MAIKHPPAGFLAPKPELIAQLENGDEPWVPDSEGSRETKVAHTSYEGYFVPESEDIAQLELEALCVPVCQEETKIMGTSTDPVGKMGHY
ncbi:UNVERIFIED_CONTAM: hypothetical protein K2H54_060721 [Gekko kuhli]